jgi:hypothetical protein
MRVGSGTALIAVIAPPSFCARKVSTDDITLNKIKGTFSANAARKLISDVIRLKGFQSMIRRTTGRLTAMGLLNRARMKNPRERR